MSTYTPLPDAVLLRAAIRWQVLKRMESEETQRIKERQRLRSLMLDDLWEASQQLDLELMDDPEHFDLGLMRSRALLEFVYQDFVRDRPHWCVESDTPSTSDEAVAHVDVLVNCFYATDAPRCSHCSEVHSEVPVESSSLCPVALAEAWYAAKTGTPLEDWMIPVRQVAIQREFNEVEQAAQAVRTLIELGDVGRDALRSLTETSQPEASASRLVHLYVDDSYLLDSGILIPEAVCGSPDVVLIDYDIGNVTCGDCVSWYEAGRQREG